MWKKVAALGAAVLMMACLSISESAASSAQPVETKASGAMMAAEHGGVFGQGDFNSAYAQYFTGKSYLKVLSKPGDPLFIANVTFEPGCRNQWHIHHAKEGGGQVLICVDGEGWYQEAGKDPQSLKPGDVVEIPANTRHWHGAKKDSWFSHVVFDVPGTEFSNEWCGEVTAEEYDRLPGKEVL